MVLCDDGLSSQSTYEIDLEFYLKLEQSFLHI